MNPVALTASEIARFWKYVDRRGPTECWLWTGSRTYSGYGQLNVGRRPVRANRIAFFLAKGRWPSSALHTCDVRACCNERHIFEGTQADNMADMRRKGRAVDPVGERSSLSKLKEADVERIIRRYRAGGITMKALADVSGVSVWTVADLVNGRTWKHVFQRVAAWVADGRRAL